MRPLLLRIKPVAILGLIRYILVKLGSIEYLYFMSLRTAIDKLYI